MLDDLRRHPEVLYGAADRVRHRRAPHPRGRRHGAAPRRRRPAGRAAAQQAADPAPRRARDLPRASSSRRSRSSTSRARCAGILLGAAVACVVGAVDDFRGLAPLPKLAGQVVAAAIPTAFGVWIDHFTFPFVGAVDLPGVGRDAADDRLDRRRDEHGQLPRRDGRARGRGLRDRRAARSRCSRSRSARSTRRSSRPSSPGPASASCATTSSRRASSWATRARSCSASRSRPSSVAGLLKTASTVVLFLPLLVLAVPIIDTSFVVAQAAQARRAGLRAPTESTSTTASSTSASRSGARR